MNAQATREDLGDLGVAYANLFGLVKSGVRPAKDAIKCIQAASDGQSDPSVSTVLDPFLTSGGFTLPEIQIAQFRQWNQAWGNFFSDQQIHDALVASPLFGWDEPQVAVTLCWAMNTLEQTIDSCLTTLPRVYGADKVFISENLRIDAEHLTLPESAPEFVANRLWWEVMDLGANRDKAPQDVPAATAAGIQVFHAACQHPGYVKRHNGDDTPYWDVPGLRVKVPGRSGPYAPCIHGSSDGRVGLSVGWADDACSNYAGVAVRE